MSRRGKCRCGCVIKFRKGPHGYKKRCPACGSIVRLRIDAKGRKKKLQTREVTCACGHEMTLIEDESRTCPNCQREVKAKRRSLSPFDSALEKAGLATEEIPYAEAVDLDEPLADALPVTDDVVSAAASALPSDIVPAAQLDPGLNEGTNTCSGCGVAIPAHRRHCPMCETRKLLTQIEGDSLDFGQPISSQEYEARKPPARNIPYLWIVVAVGLFLLCVGASLMFWTE